MTSSPPRQLQVQICLYLNVPGSVHGLRTARVVTSSMPLVAGPKDTKNGRKGRTGEKDLQKSPLPHDLASRSVAHHLAESQTDFALAATDNEITPDPKRMKQRVRSSFNRGMTIDWLELEFFDDTVQRRPPFG